MNKIIKAFLFFKKNKKKIFVYCLSRVGFLFPDKLYLKLMFRCKMGYWMNFDNPKTFSEKLQWLKLYNRNPLYTTLVDKYAVKKWVADKIGEEYIIPVLGVWNKANDIDDYVSWKLLMQGSHAPLKSNFGEHITKGVREYLILNELRDDYWEGYEPGIINEYDG